jgi:YD repeat-containing protein
MPPRWSACLLACCLLQSSCGGGARGTVEPAPPDPPPAPPATGVPAPPPPAQPPVSSPTIHFLTVRIAGDGSSHAPDWGVILSADRRIECDGTASATCVAGYPVGTTVALSAVTRAPQARLEGWGGACPGAEPQCALTMDQDREIVVDVGWHNPQVASCTPRVRPTCALFPVDPGRAIACGEDPVPPDATGTIFSAPPTPAIPTSPRDAPACEDDEYPSGFRISTQYDASERPVLVANTMGGIVDAESRVYDRCGHLIQTDETRRLETEPSSSATPVLQTRNEYRSDGLLGRSVFLQTGNHCGDQEFDYLFDDDGRVKTIFDPYTCDVLFQLTYDTAGRLVQSDRFDTEHGDPSATTKIVYDANGVRRERHSWLRFVGTEDDSFDADGQLVESSSSDSFGRGDRITRWTYDDAHRVVGVTLDASLDCHSHHETQTFAYDGSGVLLRATGEDFEPDSSCQSGSTDSRAIDYTHPSPSVTVVEYEDANGGIVSRETFTLDDRGRPTSRTFAGAPGFAPTKVFDRDYACLNR